MRVYNPRLLGFASLSSSAANVTTVTKRKADSDLLSAESEESPSGKKSQRRRRSAVIVVRDDTAIEPSPTSTPTRTRGFEFYFMIHLTILSINMQPPLRILQVSQTSPAHISLGSQLLRTQAWPASRRPKSRR